MNARLLFILLLFTIGALWYIIGYWRRKAGEAAFAAARLTEKSEERERYCRLAVMAGHREACRMFCLLHPERFDGHSPHKAVQVTRHPNLLLRILLSVTIQCAAQ